MARSDAYQQKAVSPVKTYLNWSSNEKCFTFYNKEKSSNESKPLPLKLIYLDEFATVKGFDDSSSSSIYSNEVKSTKNEPLNVRSFKGGKLISGLYADIKMKLLSLGGKYNKSIYFDLNGEIVNICLQGAALQAWTDFMIDARKSKALLDSYVAIESAADMKKGSVKYSIPVFKIGGKINEKDGSKADQNYDALKLYFEERNSEKENESSQDFGKTSKVETSARKEVNVEEVLSVESEEDLLPF